MKAGHNVLHQNILREPTVLTKPFHHSHSNKDSVWRTPYFSRPLEHRQIQFEWDRPHTDRHSLVEMAASYRAEQLEKLLRQKEIEIRLMAKQVLRTNTDNYSLMKELEKYQGKPYDDIYQENLVLRHWLSRTSRDNVILTGKLRQESNQRLQKTYNRPKTAN